MLFVPEVGSLKESERERRNMYKSSLVAATAEDTGLVVFARDTLDTRAVPLSGVKSVVVNRIHVTGFGSSVTDHDLVTTFCPYGTILYANIIHNSGPRRYGFVAFATEDSAKLLLRQVEEGGLRIYIGQDELQVRPARYAPKRTDNDINHLDGGRLTKNVVKLFPMLDAPYHYYEDWIRCALMQYSIGHQYVIPTAPINAPVQEATGIQTHDAVVYFSNSQYYFQPQVYPPIVPPSVHQPEYCEPNVNT